MPQPGTTVLPQIERRLAAIMAVDVARYSQLMGADEVGTLNALKEHRRQRIDPAIARHHGRIVKTTGDGLLVEFASVVDAVACAVAIQRAMLAFNVGVHVDRQIVLRIGINLGDVIIDGNDIFGDGVNVAARLEALCEPGGVCISRSANEQVRDKLSLSFADLGEQTVKNIARAVGVFGLAAKDIAAIPEGALPQPGPPESRTPLTPVPRRATRALMVGGIVLVAILASGSVWMLRDKTSPPVTSAVMPAAPRPAPNSAQDRRMSITVLPFENSSGNSAQDSTGADIASDVIQSIADNYCVAQLIPVANSTIYRDKPADLRAIARDYNVHFVLTGSARRQDERLKVSAALYETYKDQTIWSQGFDRPDRVDEWRGIIGTIGTKTCQATREAEVARAMHEHPGSLDKFDLYLAASSGPLQMASKQNSLAHIALLERALALDPDYVIALRSKAHSYADLVLNGFSSDPDADTAIAMKTIDRSLQLEPDDVQGLATKAHVLHAQGDLDGAAALLRKTIELRPLDGWRIRELGQIQISQGHYKEALESFLTAKQLLSPTNPSAHHSVALALLANDRFPEAIAEARLAIAEWHVAGGPAAEFPWLALIAAESENGQEAEARTDLQKFLATPRSYRTMAEIQKNSQFAGNQKLLEGLRSAGMPAE
jgi:class 3 adenylate cyclase/TolB-like protein/tetratricopeptide (TPR) repeat protein